MAELEESQGTAEDQAKKGGVLCRAGLSESATFCLDWNSSTKEKRRYSVLAGTGGMC